MARLDSAVAAGASARIAKMHLVSQMNRTHVGLFIWFLATAALFISKGDAREFWLDEIHTYNRIRLPWGELAEIVYEMGPHSPLYFWLLKLYSLIPGIPMEPGRAEAALRFPSAIMMAGAGALLIHALLRTGEHRAAVNLGLMWPFWELIPHYAVEARPYAMLMFFVALALWGAFIVLHAVNARAAVEERAGFYPVRLAVIASGIGSVGAAFSMPLGILVALIIEIGVLLSSRRHDLSKQWVQRCKIVWLLLICAAVIFLPRVVRKSAGYWTDRYEHSELSLNNIASVLAGFFGPDARTFSSGIIDPESGGEALYQFIACVPFLLLGFLVLVQWQRKNEENTPILLLLLGTLAIPTVLCLASLKASMLVERYFLPTLCFSLPLYAIWMARQRSVVGRALTILAMTSVLVTAFGAYTKEEIKVYKEVKLLLKKTGIERTNFVTNNFVYVPEMRVYLHEVASDIYYDPPQDGSPRKRAGARTGRPPSETIYWLVQSKRAFQAGAGSDASVAPHLRCSIDLSTRVVTVVAPQPEQLEPLREHCMKSADMAS
jgi:hypothetical protein